ncbi:nitroreductase family protein [Maribellus mangrovi]|uniref:nitroreductase family protein n=1 Tax=Maribellus mangrovi TaxID=3133146 RepID=UPI0030EDAE3E
MNLSELIRNRRSVRNYQDKPVPVDLIVDIIHDSILAPSAGNEQPWKFIVVRNREMIDRISAECKKNFLERIAANPDDPAKKYEKMLQNEAFHIFYHAPAVVFITGDAQVKNLVADCALAACYFMFSATSLGLGTCWVNFGREPGPELRNELGISENLKIVAPLALGYPKKIPGIPSRKEAQILKVIK